MHQMQKHPLLNQPMQSELMDRIYAEVTSLRKQVKDLQAHTLSVLPSKCSNEKSQRKSRNIPCKYKM